MCETPGDLFAEYPPASFSKAQQPQQMDAFLLKRSAVRLLEMRRRREEFTRITGSMQISQVPESRAPMRQRWRSPLTAGGSV
jgi:hypothetical protein